MSILKTPYLDQENSELNGNVYIEPHVSKQMESPFLIDTLLDREGVEELLDEDYEIFDDFFEEEGQESEIEEEWEDNFEDEFTEEIYEEETRFNDYDERYDESELEELENEFDNKKCSCNDFELEEESEFYSDDLQEDLDDDYYNEIEYDDFDQEQDEIDEAIDYEFDDYEELEAELDEDFYNYEDHELEEAFFSSLRKHFNLWTQNKKATNTAAHLPQKSHSGKPLNLPIVSMPIYPVGTLYKVNSIKNKRNYGIPETIEALKWIINELNQRYSTKVKLHIGDISQIGGGKIRNSNHSSHRMGIDVDVHLYVDGKRVQVGREEPSTGKNRRLIPYKQYSDQRKYVREFIKIVSRNPNLPLKTIGFRDRQLIKEFPGIVSDWTGHIKHLHLRFCLPDHRKSELSVNKVYSANEKKPNYICNKTALNTSTAKPQIAKPQTINIQEAIDYNNQKKHALGWAEHLKLIQIYLGYPIYSPDDSQFAKAVAIWQKKNGFRGDGKLGPQTWRKMKSVFGIINKNSTRPSSSSNSSSSNKNVSINSGSGWNGWKGKSTKGITEIPSELIKSNLDVAVAVASVPEGGAFDNVNMYDKGILSWGIKQWTVHAGSLQGLLTHIKEELELRGQMRLWKKLFPGLNVEGKTLYYNGKKYSISNQNGLINLFRGANSKVDYNEDIVNKWIMMFAIAGRHLLIQKFQFEYAKKELKEKLMLKNLGKTLKNNSNRCNSKNSSWCRELKSFGDNFKAENYGIIGKYIDKNMKAMALFNGMVTQNPMWTYIYLKRAIDILIARHKTANTGNWSGEWQNEISIILENLFAKSGVATWGTEGVERYARKNPKKKLRQSRTSKLLAAYSKYSSYVKKS